MDARRSRSTRRAHVRPSGQHFLRSSRLAADLVDRAGISSGDLVLEIGAGQGRLTDALAARAGRVIAVELDPLLAALLRARFSEQSEVTILEGDALEIPLPRAQFRVFGNIPFGITTALLRRLLNDPRSAMTGADLIVQWEVVRKRTASPPGNVLSLLWGPWWTFHAGQRIRSRSFEPPPRADGGVLSIRRRGRPQLPVRDRRSYASLVSRAFLRAGAPLRSALRHKLTAGQIRRLANELGFPKDARPIDLEIEQWVGLYRFLRRAREEAS